MQVIKRDNSKEDFNPQKIETAILKAFKGCSQTPDAESLARIKAFCGSFTDKQQLSVEEIQNKVENFLTDYWFPVGKAYILYREQHKQARLISDKIKYIHKYANSADTATNLSNTDDNANSNKKTAATLEGELYKDTSRNIQRSQMKELLAEINSPYRDQYIKDLEHHIIYQHDESCPVLKPYTYSAKEVVEVLYNGKTLLLPLDLLYTIADCPETLVDEKDVVYQKHPWQMYVKGVDNKYTQVLTLTKKLRHRPLVRVKTGFGEDLVVTDNHPMITDINDIEATVEAVNSLGQKQYRIGTQLQFKGQNTIDFISILPTWIDFQDSFIKYNQAAIKRFIPVNRDLGYIIGFFIGDGGYDNSFKYLSICQKDKVILEEINNKVYNCFGFAGSIEKSSGSNRDKYVLNIRNRYIYELFRGFFKIQDKAQNKTLPYNILEFNEEFAKGCLEGLIDADGTIMQEDCNISIRLSSRACILQCTYLFRHFGYGVGNTTQSLPFSNNTSYHTNYTIWGVNASRRENSERLWQSLKVSRNLSEYKSGNLKYKPEGYCNITSVEEIEKESAFYEQNDFIYDITTECHTFASNNLLVHNCSAYTLYPLLVDGTTNVDGTKNHAPKYLSSFCGQFCNLVFLLSAQKKGAGAYGEFFNFFSYFCEKEWGKDYWQNEDKVVTSEHCNHKMTIGTTIDQYFQSVTHYINQPASNRCYQSPFTNFNIFDSYYWHSMFDEFYFPDGSQPQWEAVNWLQKRYMKWLNKERTKTLLTFPVMTVCLLTDGTDVKDKEYKDFITTQWAEGDSFFVYLSDNADSISSCCYSKDTKVIVKDANGAYLMSFEEVANTKFASNGYRIFNNGKWSKGKVIKLPNRPMYKVTLSNNKFMIVTDNHRNNVFGGMKLTTDLTTEDYLMVNSTPCDTYAEVNENLTYEQGFAVGAFLGDGSLGSERTLACGDSHIYEVNYSLSKNKMWMKPILNKAATQCGADTEFKEGASSNNVIPLRISSKNFVAFLIRWTNWSRGTCAHNKELNMDCILQSIEFRRGIIDGWYATDGNLNSLKSGVSLRGYSTSKKLIECLDAVCTSLGYITSINIDDRTEGPVFRGIEYSKNYPVYCLLKYAENKHQKLQKEICIFRNNSYYFKVKAIEPCEYNDDVYCFEMTDKTDDLFTLANGIHNFNCRLRNEITENTFSSTTGLTGVQTGSCNVMTLNLNRIVQDFCNARKEIKDRGLSILEWANEKAMKEDFKEYLQNILDRVYDYQKAYKTGLYEIDKQGMFPQTKAGYISFDKLYCTIGVNGLNEAARFLGLTVSNNTDYMDFASWILNIIKSYNKQHSTKRFMFNLELVPAESLGVKNYNWDKEEGYWVPSDKNLYNSYIYDAHDDTSILDKIAMQGGQIAKSIDGGQASHLNLQENLSKEQYTKLLEFAVQKGNSYITFNVPQTQCDNCGFIAKHPFDKCPECGSEKVTQWTRIIGYLRPVKAWSDARQKEGSYRTFAKKEEAV